MTTAFGELAADVREYEIGAQFLYQAGAGVSRVRIERVVIPGNVQLNVNLGAVVTCTTAQYAQGLFIPAAAVGGQQDVAYQEDSVPRSRRGEALLRSYVRRFDQAFRPYEGRDDALPFEPEDYPVR